jgi:hypothetical protein
VLADKVSGKTAGRPELAACQDYLRRGDALVVPEPGPALTAAQIPPLAPLDQDAFGAIWSA